MGLLVSGRPLPSPVCRGPSSGVFLAFCAAVSGHRSAAYYGAGALSWYGPKEGSPAAAITSYGPQAVATRDSRPRPLAVGIVWAVNGIYGDPTAASRRWFTWRCKVLGCTNRGNRDNNANNNYNVPRAGFCAHEDVVYLKALIFVPHFRLLFGVTLPVDRAAVAPHSHGPAVLQDLAGPDCRFEAVFGWPKLPLGAIAVRGVAVCVMGRYDQLCVSVADIVALVVVVIVVAWRRLVLCL